MEKTKRAEQLKRRLKEMAPGLASEVAAALSRPSLGVLQQSVTSADRCGQREHLRPAERSGMKGTSVFGVGCPEE